MSWKVCKQDLDVAFDSFTKYTINSSLECKPTLIQEIVRYLKCIGDPSLNVTDLSCNYNNIVKSVNRWRGWDSGEIDVDSVTGPSNICLYSNVAGETNFHTRDVRVVLLYPDGNTLYDSQYNYTHGEIKNDISLNNVFSDVSGNGYPELKFPNENHMSRLSVMTAMLGNDGVGYETKYSTTTKSRESYRAYRIGYNSSDAIGCIRLSMKDK